MAVEAEVADVSLVDAHVVGVFARDGLFYYFLISVFVEALVDAIFAHLESWPLAKVIMWWDSVDSSDFHPSLVWVYVLIVRFLV